MTKKPSWTDIARVCIVCLRQDDNPTARADASNMIMDMAESLDDRMGRGRKDTRLRRARTEEGKT